MPVVNVGNKENPSYLPVEACEVVPGQPANTKLSPGQTASMIDFSVRKPYLNAKAIVDEGATVLGLPNANQTLVRHSLRVCQAANANTNRHDTISQ